MSLLLGALAGKLLKTGLKKAFSHGKPSPADSVVTTRTKVTPFTYDQSRTVQYDHSPAGPAGAQGMALMGCAPRSDGRGFRATRLNKSTYVTRGGGTSRWPQQLVLHPKGTECVTVRRRHVTNAKALRRAISRVKGFVKTYRKAAAALGVHRRSGRSGCASCGRNPCRCK